MLNSSDYAKNYASTIGKSLQASQNAYEMFRFLNFRNLKKKTNKKNTELLSFGQTYKEFYGCH